MFRKLTVSLVVAMLVVGATPGVTALGPPGGDATEMPRASDGPTSVAICGQSSETLTVDAGPDFETSKDETVRFVADLDPDDAEARVASYEWRDESGNQNQGKGRKGGRKQSGEVLSTQKSFETQLKAGKHTITLTVETTDGRTLTDTVNVTVRGSGGGSERDSPPEADAGDCRMVIANEDTQLDGTESYDRDGTVESYDWDTDGDGETDVTGETPTVRFETLGNRTVELAVTDDGGNTDTDTVNLFVNDRPRAAFDYAPTRPNPEESVTFDASAASDDLGGIDAYRWDFDGDGTTDATGETVTHAFETPGDHTVALTVVDAYGVSNTTATTVHVNHPPTADASESDQRGNVGESVALDGTASTDPEGAIARYEWDVDGDGEFEKTGKTANHTFETAGDQNVTLRVTDDRGLTDTDTITIAVNSPPTARIDASNETIVVGGSVAFDGTDSTDSDGEIVRYEWDFDGDGTTDATGETAEHTFENDGGATVRLTVTDDDGATDTATKTIVVLPDDTGDEPSGVPSPPDDSEGGDTIGDPHFSTFDGREYDFQGAGEYVVARAPDGSLSVQGRFDPINGTRVSVVEAVATSLDGHNLTIDAADETPLVVDGERYSLEPTDRLAVGNGTVFRRGSQYIVVYPGDDGEVDDGDERLSVRVHADRLDLWLTLRDDRANAVEGLMGTSADSEPDIALADGTPVSPSSYDDLYGPFRDDWRVDSFAESNFHYEDGESPDAFYDPDFPGELLTVEDLPDDERSAAEQAAIEAGLEPGTTAFEDAVLDYALTGDESYLESAALSQPANASFAVEAGSSFEAGVNDSVTFAATVSNESAENVTVEWRFGDGAIATGTEASHAYDATGTYTVTVTATGPNGGIARDTLAVTVGENATTDQPPIADVEVTRLNETHVRLDASESIDPDGTIAGYVWDIDGDGGVDSRESAVTVARESNSTEVSLVVLDDDGNRATETVPVPVLNDAPTANVIVESFEDGSYTDDWTYIRNGDGFTAEVTADRAQNGSHSLSVYSNDFGRLNKSIPTTSRSGPYTFWLYQDYRPGDDFLVSWFDGSDRVFGLNVYREITGNIHIYDSNGDDNTGAHFPTDVWTRVTFTDVNWSDGSYRYEVVTASGTVVTQGTKSFDPSVVDNIDNVRIDSASQWRGHGEYYIDNFTASNNERPVANASVNASTAAVGESVRFDASDSSDPDGDSLTYEWDFDGDGTTDATGETVTHAYAETGTYEATVTVSDGAVFSTANVSVTVGTSTEIVDSFEVSDLSRYSGAKNHFQLTTTFAQDGQKALGMNSNQYQYHLWLDRGPQELPRRGSTVRFDTRIDGGSHYIEYHFGKQSKAKNARGYSVRISTVHGGEIKLKKDGDAVRTETFDIETGEKYLNEVRWTSTGIEYVVYRDGTEVASLTLDDTAYDSGYIGYGHNDVSPFGENSGIDAYIDYVRIPGENSEPVADATASPTTAEVGETVTFDASSSSDPDGDSLTYEWDLDGDGTVDATGETVTHSYPETGTYNATVRVSDERGESSTDTVTVTATSGEAVTDGLVGHWQLDETSGTTAYDDVGTHDGTIRNSPKIGVSGVEGTAYAFDSDADKVTTDFDSVSGSRNRAISFWVKTTYSSDRQLVVSQGESNPSGGEALHLRINSNGDTRLAVIGGNRVWDTNLNDGEWHHVVFVLNGSEVSDTTLYVDGTAANAIDGWSQYTNIDTATAKGLHFGTHINHNDRDFVGTLDEVRYYDRALNQTEVNEIYNDEK